MQRRLAVRVLVLFPFGLVTGAAGAQTSGKVTRIGLLDAGERLEWWDAFRQQMRELGYIEGSNVVYVARYAKGKPDALPALAKALVAADVSIIVTGGAQAGVEAKHATGKIPIVLASGTDYVSLGLASSLSRPGSNVTGLASVNSELMNKRLDLLRELRSPSQLGVLWHADNPPSMASVRDLEGAAARLGISFHSYGIHNDDEIADAFAAMGRDRIDGLVVVHGPYIFAVRKRIAELAARSRIPAMYGAAEYVDAGGLAAYAPSYPEMFRNAAVYVDRILKGADPATMPIEQPTKFELVLNAKAASAIGVAIPRQMQERATLIKR